jgi:exodeoxyribonuclease V alpha subunit
VNGAVPHSAFRIPHVPAGLSELDVHFARLIGRLGGEDGAVSLAAALASQATGRGHICLDLAAIAGRPVAEDDPEAGPTAPPLGPWLAALRGSPAVGRPGDFAPLVLDDAGRLYLHRYWAYERAVADDLTRRLADEPGDVDLPRLRAGLDRLFPKQAGADGQRVAAATAVLRRFTVISGGPGTGKTTTVIRLLALLAEQAAGTPFRAGLAAPTGKAAARMQEVIRAAKQALPVEAPIRDAIPEEAATIHRLLGWQPAGGFRHGRDNPLALDVLVVDEASMVDLGLMAKLLLALPPSARLVLVGDRDQLASVAAGAVLGDICAGTPGCSARFRARLRAATGDDPGGGTAGPAIRDAVVLLTESYRFAAGSGIGQAARLVNGGDGAGARAVLTSPDFPEVGWRTVDSPRKLAHALGETVPAAFGESCATPEAALATFDRLRILCARRGGPFGVEAVNRIAEDRLRAAGCLPRLGRWYPGRPVLVTANDYHLRLFNGDLGVALPDPEGAGGLRVVCRGSKNELRRFAPARLPAHETAYATTVHRSQGTEAERVVLILPSTPSPVLTRELLYTALTRARAQVEVWGTAGVFDAGVEQRIARSSGLRDALWGGRP